MSNERKISEEMLPVRIPPFAPHLPPEKRKGISEAVLVIIRSKIQRINSVLEEDDGEMISEAVEALRFQLWMYENWEAMHIKVIDEIEDRLFSIELTTTQSVIGEIDTSTSQKTRAPRKDGYGQLHLKLCSAIKKNAFKGPNGRTVKVPDNFDQVAKAEMVLNAFNEEKKDPENFLNAYHAWAKKHAIEVHQVAGDPKPN